MVAHENVVPGMKHGGMFHEMSCFFRLIIFVFLYVKKELQCRRCNQELSQSVASVACKNGRDLKPVMLLSS